jgi:predicted aminopeptidase
MASEPRYGPLTGFLLQLADDEERNRQKAIDASDLSDEDKELLKRGNFDEIRARVEAEAQEVGARAWFLVRPWFRPTY